MKETNVDISKIVSISLGLGGEHLELVEEYSGAFKLLCLWFPVSTNYYEWNFDGQDISRKSAFLRS